MCKSALTPALITQESCEICLAGFQTGNGMFPSGLNALVSQSRRQTGGEGKGGE